MHYEHHDEDSGFTYDTLSFALVPRNGQMLEEPSHQSLQELYGGHVDDSVRFVHGS